jgi:hypothetical protein
VQQLDYVYRFFKPIAGKAKSFQDVHLYAFAPSSFSFKDNHGHVIGSEVGQASLFASQNRAFDVNKNGSITVGEFKNYGNTWLKSKGVALPSAGAGNNMIKNLAIFGLIYYLFSSE